MGAFFLYKSDSEIERQKIIEIYNRKGFLESRSFQLGAYKLDLYRKQLLGIDNYYCKGTDSIFVCGSLFYKCNSYKKSLEILLEDFIIDKVESNLLFGNYVIFFFNEITKKLTFSIDPSFIKCVYFDERSKILSTDFLSILKSTSGNFSLNRIAILENLTTGHLISPDTYANEIQRIDRVNFSLIDKLFEGINTKVFYPSLVEQPKCREEAIQNANNHLSNYFAQVKELAEEFGAHVGLTGGMDSRLLLIHARMNINKIIANSFWRKESLDFKYAKELAVIANIDFYSFENDPIAVPEKNELLTEAYYFQDGQIRSQNNWDEEFSYHGYTASISADHFVGFHGCGGEQYRNADRIRGRINIEDYIRYEWMFKQAGNVFTDKSIMNDLTNHIKNKILRLLGRDYGQIGLVEIKKIQNEIWNTSNRATRVNLINQQQFYFAPFTEFQISHTAYHYIPYLGSAFRFQIEMMKSADKKLSSVKTNYGFDLLNGEPFVFKIAALIANCLPRFVFYIGNHRIKKINTNIFPYDEFIKGYHPFFREYGSKINLKKFSMNRNLGNSLNTFDFMLKHSNLLM